MVELNKDKIQIKYITGLNKTLEGYPTPLDILYDSCVESMDDCLFSEAKMENKYGIDEDRIKSTIKYLLDKKFIVKKNSKYKIIDNIWH
jgi:hypothetical protein